MEGGGGMRKILIFFGIFVFTARIFSADTEQEKIKKLIEKYKNAVVTVRIIKKEWSVMEGKEFSKTERKNEVTGTIIDKNGTVIISAFAADPAKFFNRLNKRKFFGFEWRSQITGIKIILPDKREIDGKIVLKDEKLDLLFIKPEKKKDIKFEFVNLKDYKQPEIMEKIVMITRMGKIGDRIVFASLSRIGGIIKKPRIYYLSTAQMAPLGSPVFTVDGKVVGINLIRARSSDMPLSFFTFSLSDFGILPVILPAEEIGKIASKLQKNQKKK